MQSTSSVRRLLIISYHFPPDGSIGGQRWAGLSKYLARAGWEVHVITASAPGAAPPIPGIHRHFRPRRRTLNEMYRARVAGREARAAAGQRAIPGGSEWAQQTNPIARGIAIARRVVGSAMGLPDHGRGWLSSAAVVARSLMSRYQFDCVVSSGPPHSSHFVGLVSTLGANTDFWIDMRDPWSLTHEMNSVEDGFIRAERRFLDRLESLVLPRASRVLANTSEFAAALRASRPSLNVTHFPNGVDLEQLPKRDLSAVSIGSIAYVGTLYAGRNLSSVLEAMRLISAARQRDERSLTLNIAGPLESPHRKRMHDEIESAGLAASVNVLGILPRAGALDLLSRAHLALVLAQDQPLCVPAKLYESVGLGVPTLVLAERDSAAACEARRIGAMTAEGNDVEGIRSVLGDLLSGSIPTELRASAPISYQDLAAEMDHLLREGAPERIARETMARTQPRFA
jgi:glycosyltransferase involved in cell wall biosynthesis